MPTVLASFSLQPSRCCALLTLVVTASLLTLTGCGGPSHGDRIPLNGTVTLQGVPLDVNATIYFNPPAGQSGIGSSGQVSGGRFSIPEESGATPGQTLEVIVITAPGIPPDGTPRDQMKIATTYKSTVTIPSRGDGDQELKIEL